MRSPGRTATHSEDSQGRERGLMFLLTLTHSSSSDPKPANLTSTSWQTTIFRQCRDSDERKQNEACDIFTNHKHSPMVKASTHSFEVQGSNPYYPNIWSTGKNESEMNFGVTINYISWSILEKRQNIGQIMCEIPHFLGKRTKSSL